MKLEVSAALMGRRRGARLRDRSSDANYSASGSALSTSGNHTLGISFDVFEHLEVGVAVLSREGELIYFNPRFSAILNDEDGLEWNGTCFVVVSREANTKFQSVIASRWNSASHQEPRETVLIPRPSGLMPYVAVLGKVTRGVGPSNAPSELSPDYLPIFIADPARNDQINEKALIRLFALSPSEARLAVALAATGSLATAAAQCHLTMGSARIYLKRIFDKTDTKSQVELMILILAGLPV